ncbi:MAG: hypothetical protein H0X30_02415 [Anaerolineae bacterium]|nr:hypothetical protein [Anaerolineae bacterium]
MMFARLTSRRVALWLFGMAATFMILVYIAVFLPPDASGHVGIYMQQAIVTLVWLYIAASVILILSVILYGIRSRRLTPISRLVLLGLLLFAPILTRADAPQILRQHQNTLVVGDHVYQLSQDMFQTCQDTFDSKTYTCSNRIFLYQCDRTGVLCSIKSADDVLVHHEAPLNLRLNDNQIEVISDQDQVVYTMPA